MKILAFTDTHASRRSTERILEMAAAHEPAFLVCAGDFTTFGQFAEPLFDALATGGARVHTVAGNHEHGLYAAILARYPNVVDLDRRVVESSGVRLAGLSHTTALFSRTGEAAAEVEDFLAAIGAAEGEARVDVFVSHQPPFGTAVAPRHRDRDSAVREELGLLTARAIIERLRPRLAICGHIHVKRPAETLLGECRVVNPGSSGLIIEL